MLILPLDSIRQTPSDYNGVPGYYAHGHKLAGDFSQYGEQSMVLLRSLVANESKYNRAHYEKLFCEHFGYGGQYVGYIDHPTRDTLNNIANLTPGASSHADGINTYHGADDEQLPALAKLPPLIAVYQGNRQLNEVVKSAVRVSNNNDLAVDFGLAAAALIEAIIQGKNIESAIRHSCSSSPQAVTELMEKALFLTAEDNLAVTAKFGTACKLVYGVPSLIHNALTSDSYTSAIRNNIYAGGDSCGRGIVLGAVLGAAYGVGGEKGVPLEWIEKVRIKDEVNTLIEKLLHA